MLNSKVYVGRVCHTRLRPQRHQFCYRLFMLYLDLDEIPEVFDAYWLWQTRPTYTLLFSMGARHQKRHKPQLRCAHHLHENQTPNKHHKS